MLTTVVYVLSEYHASKEHPVLTCAVKVAVSPSGTILSLTLTLAISDPATALTLYKLASIVALAYSVRSVAAVLYIKLEDTNCVQASSLYQPSKFAPLYNSAENVTVSPSYGAALDTEIFFTPLPALFAAQKYCVKYAVIEVSRTPAAWKPFTIFIT